MILSFNVGRSATPFFSRIFSSRRSKSECLDVAYRGDYHLWRQAIRSRLTISSDARHEDMTAEYPPERRRIKASMQNFVWMATIILSVVILFPKLDQNVLVDFGSSWSAARLLCHGANPYDVRSLLRMEKTTGWVLSEAVVPWNPPWALSIMIPFSFLPFVYAKWVWTAVNGFLILALADYWWRLYGGTLEHRMASWLAALWFFPCIVALYFGQTSLIVLAGVTGIEWSLRRRKTPWLSFFILLAALKPHLLLPMWLILILWLTRQKQWKMLAWASSGIVLACIVVGSFRPEVYSDYVLRVTSIQGPVIWATPTIGTALRVAFPNIPKWIVFLPGFCGLLLSMIFLRRLRGAFTWKRHLDLILLLSLTTASYAWIFDWAILLPIVIRVLVWFGSSPRQQWSSMGGLVCAMIVFVWEQARGLFPLGAVWFPWGLMLVYVWARRQQDRIEAIEMRSPLS